MKDKLAWPFLQPVDPIAHQCPQYFDWIKEPMDLGTIKTRLNNGSHYKSVLAIMRDVRLVWSNCRYRGPSTIWASPFYCKAWRRARGTDRRCPSLRPSN